MKDEDLAKALNLQVKELTKAAGKLKAERLIKIDSRAEEVKGPPTQYQRQKAPRLHYYIDWKQFVNVVKWKVHSISRILEKQVSTNIGTYTYKCPGCLKEFSMLEVNSLENSELGFICDQCATLLSDDLATGQNLGSSEKYTRFMDEIKPILSILREADKLVIPEFNPLLIQSSSSAVATDELSVSKELGAHLGDVLIEINKDVKEEPIQQLNQAQADYYKQLNSTVENQAIPIASADHSEHDKAKRESGASDAQGNDLKRARFDQGDEEDSDEDEFIDVETANETTVSVNGNMVPIHLITEDHQVIMTPEEYLMYEKAIHNSGK